MKSHVEDREVQIEVVCDASEWEGLPAHLIVQKAQIALSRANRLLGAAGVEPVGADAVRKVTEAIEDVMKLCREEVVTVASAQTCGWSGTVDGIADPHWIRWTCPRCGRENDQPNPEAS